MGSKKRKRLEAAVGAIQQRWGQRALRRGARPAPVAAIPTGFAALDTALDGCGGIPLGRLSEILGAPTSGMTTLALKIIVQAQRQSHLAAYVDLNGTFDPDYAARCEVDLKRLILAGALDGWGMPRRTLLWVLGQLRYQVEELALIWSDEEVSLPPLSPAETQLWEQEMLGLSTGPHLLSRYRRRLNAQGILSSIALKKQPSGRFVRVAGLVVVHQAPPTANGFHFVTLENLDGLIDLILRPSIYACYRQLFRKELLLLAEGTVQQQAGVTNLLVERMASLPQLEARSKLKPHQPA